MMAASVPGTAGPKSWKRSCYRSHGSSVEHLRTWRREREAALRSARRVKQLFSKRRLCEDKSSDGKVEMDNETAALLSEEEVSQLLKKIQRGSSEDRTDFMQLLRQGLQYKEIQQKFISNLANLQMDAACCLHELSLSTDPAVVEACLPATSYLLTYLSGHSVALMELCLYTLGNLVVEMKAVKKHLLPQGIISVLASCIQSPHVMIQEGVGYVLSQLLQSKEAAAEIIPLLLESTLPQHMLHLVCSRLEDGIGTAVECAWGLHYIICSQVNNSLLISQRTMPSLVQLLLELSSQIATTSVEGLELLICPVVRCVGNLLAEDKANNDELQIKEECLLKALFVFMQFFLPKHTFVVSECLWLLNNLTVQSTTSCSALLSLEVFSDLLKLLRSYQVISLLVLTVLCNIAAKGAAYCEMLHQKAVLPSLVNILVFSDVQVVGQNLELLHLIFLYWPKAAIDFVNHSGLHALQQHQNNLHLQEQVKVLIHTVSQITGVPQNNPLGTENLHFTSLQT
ncbi:PREDICTED: transmembrane and coiled-coil domain-containing protein 6 isoform X2 [Thamnophis sirtalis]|uniref:Transmembrane and coiled-coil domain-containing protein 6 isoform X2 n=1 Tax=Thamnophis sirtalis TaxID=35019 RepID=A0A6I9YDU3_9SAUR|nr:PREDICTED: transmembrane and coiled-coil domain-containing protein 6 isoform X2 [Thamnophis sirtalis]